MIATVFPTVIESTNFSPILLPTFNLHFIYYINFLINATSLSTHKLKEMKSRWCHKWKNSKHQSGRKKEERFKCKLQQHKSFFFTLFYNIRIHIVIDSFHFVFTIITAMGRSLLTSWSHVNTKNAFVCFFSCIRKRKTENNLHASAMVAARKKYENNWSWS